MDRETWCAAVHGVAKSWTRLSSLTFTFHFHALEKEMATHSSILAWRIPGTGEPGGLPFMGSHRTGRLKRLSSSSSSRPPSITNSRSSLTLTSIGSVMPSSISSSVVPLLLLPPIPPTIRVFSDESALCMRWPKYWSFSFSIIPSKEHPGLISFRMDWLDLLAVQGTLKSLLQHHSSKASILQCSAFFTVQLSHPYMTTGKTIALTRWTFVSKVMSPLLNIWFQIVVILSEMTLSLICILHF